MTYDLLIKNGRVVDGTGSPAFNADIGIRNGKIAEIGKLSGKLHDAKRVIDAKGKVVAPGFIDSHTHFDAQVLWDPLCTWSCYHGVTTVITGNCSLGIAPVRPGKAERASEFLSYVEAIPLETLLTVKPTWETFGQYLDTIERRLGVNVGALVGHTPIRYYVMGDECQGRDPTAQEIEQMKKVTKESMESGALGLSFSMNKGHFDPQGNNIPSVLAKEEEVFALTGVLGELGTGIVQVGSGKGPEQKSQFLSRIYEQTGRPVVYGALAFTMRKPDGWKEHIETVEGAVKKGIRALPQCTPIIQMVEFNMHNGQVFRHVPSWRPIQIATDEEKMKAYQDPVVRKKLHHEAVEWPEFMDKSTLGKNWPDTVKVRKAKLEKNRKYEDMSVSEIAQATGKGIIDAFLDLVVEEALDTDFVQLRRGSDPEVMGQILNYSNALIGNSDAGAHVQFRCGYGYSTFLLSHWVRKHKVMTVETAVKKLTFELAQFFGIYDRGLLQPGMAADIVIFDPDTVRPLPQETATDLPGGAWRTKELSEGIQCTIVNGQVFIEDGKHTGALAGRVVRNSLYRERQDAAAFVAKAVSV